MPSLVLESTWANAGGTVIIYLAALTGVNAELYEAASVDGAGALAEGLARHAAAAARHPARDDDPADHRDGAGVPRAVPVHVGRPGQRDDDGAAADLQLRVRQLARRRLRQGGRAQPDAGRASSRSSRSSTCARRARGARDDAPRHGDARAATRAAGPALAGRLDAARASGGARNDARAPARRCSSSFGLGPDPLARKAAITPTEDTLSHPMALFPHGFGLEQPARGLDGRPRRPLLLEHGRARVRLVARADRRRDHGRLRALGAPAEVRAGHHGAAARRRCSSPRSCCSCRCTSRSCTRRSSTTRSSTATGRSGCRPARARSTSCS